MTSISSSSSCSGLDTDDESPFTGRFPKHAGVQFQELATVAWSSGSSPVPGEMSTPQLLKRFRETMAHEEGLRDKLEQELADQINIISEKDGLILQLQYRVDRMLREQRELEENYKAALLELQEKNESLLRRVHKVVKQCQDLKDENYQKEEKLRELTEENQTVSAQKRNAFAQLARAEEEVSRLALAHDSAQAEWRSREEFLEDALNEAVTHRECVSEQVQILQGKISVLEDELRKAQSQERGEVLGPIMEALTKIERLQARTLELSEQISLKDGEIRNLRNEYDSVDHELKLVKEQNIEINEMLRSNRKEHEETVKKLQQELRSASSAASERSHLTSLKRSLQRECDASQKIRDKLELKVKEQNGFILALKKASRQWEEQNQDLLEQLKAKSEAVEHYKAQGTFKKQWLAEAQETNKHLEQLLEASKREVKALETELKLARVKLDQADAKVDFGDRQQRAQRKSTEDIGVPTFSISHVLRVSENCQDRTTDSLEFELNDSLNANGQLAVPRESSTPLVRSSECLAAKRRALRSESLETLYFTPMSKQRSGKRKVDHNQSWKTPAPESAEGKDLFFSLHSTRSQPNFAVHHSRPIPLDLSEESLSKTDSRSTVPSIAPPRATSTFSTEPEQAAVDWMRVAELQARNKACPPHLKSSYPWESSPCLGPLFPITDDDLRMGDPEDTIQRASLALGQTETLNSRCCSLAPGASSSQGPALSQPQIRSSTAAHRPSQPTKRSAQLRASESKRSPLTPKRPGSQLQCPDTPEVKKLASCFPRPMTPKGRLGNSQNRPPNSPAERRLSVMFSCRSPAVASRAVRKCPRNESPESSSAKKMTYRIKV